VKGIRSALALPVAVAVLLAPAAAGAAPAAALGGYDVGDLMGRAEKAFDLATADAVVLLDSQTVDLSTAGERRTTVHRIVWIATELAIGTYADERVPHSAEEGSLNVIALRTWRDGRWWPHESTLSPTAIVETLPFALESADDYTDMRETMLLHDGIEIPCIIEVAYTVVDKLAPGAGDDGLRLFAGDDPAVVREFVLITAGGTPMSHAEGNGAPEPAREGSDKYAWRMELVDRLPRPLVADAAQVAPYVAWSTWPSWDALAANVDARFSDPAPLAQDLRDSLALALRDAPTPRSKAVAVAEFVNEGTRFVDYDPRHWAASPRPAARTWETAYGHRLDRAVLAAALFREAGLEVSPCYRSRGRGTIDAGVPGLARFEGVSLLVRGDGLEAYYDPAAGAVADGAAPFFGRTVWVAGKGRTPEAARGGAAASAVRLTITLAPAEDGGWTGTGFYDAGGAFSPHDEIAGLADEASGFLGGMVGAAVEGTEVTDLSFERLDADRTTAGFAVSLAAPEPDDRGRIKLTLGEPGGGLVAALPSDVRLFEERRASPVLLAGPLEQEVELRLELGDREVVFLPAERSIENAVGRFALTVERKDERVTVRRTLEVRMTAIGAAEWPLLRALLLEETDARSGVLYLK
jgi:hypothetical protein